MSERSPEAKQAERASDPGPRSSRVLGRPAAAARGRRRFGVGVLLSVWQPSTERADLWLVQLRWLAVLGMGLTIAAAKMLVPGLHATPALVVLGLIAASNVLWWLGVRRWGSLGALTSEALPRRLVVAQVSADLLALSTMLWFTGGVSNPFAGFLTFQIALAGLLTGPRVTLAIATASVASLAGLTLAPRLPLESAVLGVARTELAAMFVALVSHSAFLGFFVAVYARRLEQLRDQAGRNEKLAMLGKLVGGLSHELATPIATILLAGKDLASSKLGDPELDALARTVEGEATRATEILGLLRGNIRPDPSTATIELRALVHRIAATELDRAGFSGKRVLVRGPDVALTVLESAVRQIVLNLIRNAVDATRHDDDARIVVAVDEVPAGVEISVEDSGPGFSPSVLAHLGEPFQTTKQAEGGLGLGLYTCSLLAERVGGTLRVESDPGRGARVVLFMPRD